MELSKSLVYLAAYEVVRESLSLKGALIKRLSRKARHKNLVIPESSGTSLELFEPCQVIVRFSVSCRHFLEQRM
jgi:hypothetical protein